MIIKFLIKIPFLKRLIPSLFKKYVLITKNFWKQKKIDEINYILDVRYLIDKNFYLRENYEDELFAFAKNKIIKDEINYFLDVGSCWGIYSLRLSKIKFLKIIAFDPYIDEGEVSLNIHPSYDFKRKINVKTTTKEDVLAQSDFISLHIPGGQGYVLDSEEFNQMKDGVGIVNCARGGTISENALIEAISSQKVKYVATDVFENEPPTDDRLLRMDNVGLSPHIGASTQEAQERVGLELAQSVIDFFS